MRSGTIYMSCWHISSIYGYYNMKMINYWVLSIVKIPANRESVLFSILNSIVFLENVHKSKKPLLLSTTT